MSVDKHRMYYLIDAVARRMKTTADEALLKSAGLTTSQVTALRIILNDGPISPNEVAQKLGQRKSAMTTMVRRLESAGFIVTSPSDTDKRSYVLQSTKAGERAIAHLVDAFVGIDSLIGEKLTSKAISRMSSDLETMLAVLNEDRLRKKNAGRSAA